MREKESEREGNREREECARKREGGREIGREYECARIRAHEREKGGRKARERKIAIEMGGAWGESVYEVDV